MTCFNPLPAIKTGAVYRKTGKPVFGFVSLDYFLRVKFSSPDICFMLPCGQCIGCRLERSRQWAIRCLHEASLHNFNCFITLTFDQKHLLDRSNPFTVDPRDFQLFMKRLRKRLWQDHLRRYTLLYRISGIFSKSLTRWLANKLFNSPRYFSCGEYGDKFGRPHYHACLFGVDFPDKVLWKEVNGFPLYTSKILSSLWPFGFSSIGAVSFESAAYVARYIMKKVSGDKAKEHYQLSDDDGYSLLQRFPEYTTMSRRPGIAKGWFEKFREDVYVAGTDSVRLRGKKCRPPKYYDSLLEMVDPSLFEVTKTNRVAQAVLHEEDNTPDRLWVRERLKKLVTKSLIRPLE
jgi:hypothetical protein